MTRTSLFKVPQLKVAVGKFPADLHSEEFIAIDLWLRASMPLD